MQSLGLFNNHCKASLLTFSIEINSTKKKIREGTRLMRMALFHLACLYSASFCFLLLFLMKLKTKENRKYTHLSLQIQRQRQSVPNRPLFIGCHKNVPPSHKNDPLVQKRTSYLDTVQQDKQLSITFLWDTGTFFWDTR